MTAQNKEINNFVENRYQHGFVTDIESESIPPGLNEDVIRAISAKKNEPKFMLEWRLNSCLLYTSPSPRDS